MMKKLFTILLALLLILSMTACGKNNTPGSTAAPAGSSVAADKTEPAATEKPGAETTKAAGEVGWAMIPGTLNFIGLKDGETPALKALQLSGNQAGEAEGFNNKPASAEDIRCIFELNEWIEVYPDTDETHLGLLIVNHLEDQTDYETLTFSDGITIVGGYVAFIDLTKPESGDDSWGNFYLHSDENKEGYYDFVFTVGGKPVATLLTRFYNESELSEKTDAELEKIQKGLEPLQVK